MNTTPRRVRTQLEAASTLLNNLAQRLPTALENAIEAAHEDTNHRDHTNPPGRRPGWISDTTGEQAINHLGNIERHLDLFPWHLETLRLALAHLANFADTYTHTQPNRRLCGDYAPSNIRQHPAFNPACRNVAESDTIRKPDGTYERTYRSNGICTTCRRNINTHDSIPGSPEYKQPA